MIGIRMPWYNAITLCVTLVLSSAAGCTAQSPEAGRSGSTSANAVERVGGPFENAEFIYIGMPDSISSIDTSEGWAQEGQKLLVTGTIYMRDGRTPAPNVILYYYHTDVGGHYSSRSGLDSRVVRHGYIRGWVKSDAKGHYSIYTVRPAPYPGADIPAHIHPTIKEPGINEYYIDEFAFDDDKLLTGAKRKKLENRGGSGILRPYASKGLQIAVHDIVLGLNIPNYPADKEPSQHSGLQIGEDQPSFMPYHAWGPDKGSRACPVCKYGLFHGIVYFVGNDPDWAEIKNWLAYLEKESVARQKYLKVYFVYGNEQGYSPQARQKELEQLGQELGIKNSALTYVPSFSDTKSEVNLNRIDPSAKNTIVIYRRRQIVDKFVNLTATPEHLAIVSAALDRTRSEYFDLAEPQH